jgi:hypothetical protein
MLKALHPGRYFTRNNYRCNNWNYKSALCLYPYFFGTFLVPALPLPQPAQGKFPSCPLASQSISFENRKKIFLINDFSAEFIFSWLGKSTPK